MSCFTIAPASLTNPDPDYPASGRTRDTLGGLQITAALKGLTVRTPKLNELFLDIDSYAAEVACRKLIGRLEDPRILSSTWTPSPSGALWHWHVVVTLDRPVRDACERVMLQALLGSDPMRELLSLERIQNGSDDDAVSVFFERAP